VARAAGGKEAPLRRDVRSLGRLLGAVLKEQAGAALFDAVEELRSLTTAQRETADAAERERLMSRAESVVGRASVEEAYRLTKAFAIYFELTNLAETNHRKRRRRAAEVSGAEPQAGTFLGTLRRVRGAGLRVMLTVSGPGPVWSSRSPAKHNPRYRPDPARYADFASAVARRYGADVDRYILWNEPNLPSWLQPQAKCTRHGCMPVAPNVYRGLVRAAYPAVKAADPGAQVLIGAMSSRGQNLRSRNSTLRPMVFLRALGCVTASFRRLRSGGRVW